MTVKEYLDSIGDKFLDEQVDVKEVFVGSVHKGIVGVSFSVRHLEGIFVFTVSSKELESTKLMMLKSSEINAYAPSGTVVLETVVSNIHQIYRLDDCLEKRVSNFDWDSSEKREDCVYLKGMCFKKDSVITLDYLPNIMNAVSF